MLVLQKSFVSTVQAKFNSFVFERKVFYIFEEQITMEKVIKSYVLFSESRNNLLLSNICVVENGEKNDWPIGDTDQQIGPPEY